MDHDDSVERTQFFHDFERQFTKQLQQDGNNETINLNYSTEEFERMKFCGMLFDRRSTINKELIDEFFHKEPCVYNQVTYKYAARIFNCLKADLNENEILKSLKTDDKDQKLQQVPQQQQQPNQVAEVPRINYKDNEEKKNTLKLAFSILRFQKLLEQILEECQFYLKYPQAKDEHSLVCTILFDYMMRKFQERDNHECDHDNLNEKDTTLDWLENCILHEKTNLAASLAKNRIKADALTIEELLPIDLREVEHHKAELPLYCWVNIIKTDLNSVIQHLVEEDGLTFMDSLRGQLDKKGFQRDPHVQNLLMFHFTLRDKILKHDFIKYFKLVVQDKSSCLATITVRKLLYKRDDVIVANVGGGLNVAYLGCLMKELDGRVYAYGSKTDEKIQEIQQLIQNIGCQKYVKLIKEDFLDVRFDETKLINSKVILINAPCTKSALMNPMEFLFHEREDLHLLRDFSVDLNNESRLKRSMYQESLLLKHALRFSHVRAIVYQTYSKYNSENELLVNKISSEFNDVRKSNVFPYKLSPPLIPLTIQDLQTDIITKGVKYLQFKPSHLMNGCFVALLTRDVSVLYLYYAELTSWIIGLDGFKKDAKVDREARKAEILIEKKARAAAIQAAQDDDADESDLLKSSDRRKSSVQSNASSEANSTNSHETSLSEESDTGGIKKRSNRRYSDARSKKLSRQSIPGIGSLATRKDTLEEQIIKLEHRGSIQHQQQFATRTNEYSQVLPAHHMPNRFENRLNSIGRMGATRQSIVEMPQIVEQQKVEQHVATRRSSTPELDTSDEKLKLLTTSSKTQHINLKEYEFKLENRLSKIGMLTKNDNNLDYLTKQINEVQIDDSTATTIALPTVEAIEYANKPRQEPKKLSNNMAFKRMKIKTKYGNNAKMFTLNEEDEDPIPTTRARRSIVKQPYVDVNRQKLVMIEYTNNQHRHFNQLGQYKPEDQHTSVNLSSIMPDVPFYPLNKIQLSIKSRWYSILAFTAVSVCGILSFILGLLLYCKKSGRSHCIVDFGHV